MVKARLCFDLTLPALPEEVIEQVRGVLHMVHKLDRLYVALKARLLQLLTPKPAYTCLKLIFSGELGDRRPSQLMETMLALLPPGEEDGILFKTLFVTKLPREVRSHVLARGMNLSSREMADLADDFLSGTLAGEAALGHVLAVPRQLLPTTGLPGDTPAPSPVIPAAKQT